MVLLDLIAGGLVRGVVAVADGAGVARSGRAAIGQGLASVGLPKPALSLLATIGGAHGQQDQGERQAGHSEPAGQ